MAVVTTVKNMDIYVIYNISYAKEDIFSCKIIHTVKSYLSVGHLISCFSWVGQNIILRSQQNIYLVVLLVFVKSTSKSVHKIK